MFVAPEERWNSNKI